MFMNIHTLQCDAQLPDFFRFDMTKLDLPKIAHSSHPTAFGYLSTGILSGVLIAGCLGDQSAACVGQKVSHQEETTPTELVVFYYKILETTLSSRTNGLLATVVYDFNGKPQYALEDSIAVAGSSTKFLQNNFGFIENSAQIGTLSATVPDNGGCTFVIAFSGLFAPYWIDGARGIISGTAAFTQKRHIARAILEATYFQPKAILDSMQRDSGHTLAEPAVDG